MNKIFFSVLIATQISFAATVNFKSTDGLTEFTAVGKPAMLKINGEGKGPEGQLKYDNEILSGTLTVELKNLTTKIDLRDTHMKNKYLEVEKYPTAELIIKDLKLPSDPKLMTDKDVDVPFTGQLTLHGKTQPINGTAKVKKVANAIKGEATFSIKIMEFLDTLPSYAGIKVAEDVKVKVQLNGQLE